MNYPINKKLRERRGFRRQNSLLFLFSILLSGELRTLSSVDFFVFNLQNDSSNLKRHVYFYIKI